jgi:Caspase domain
MNFFQNLFRRAPRRYVIPIDPRKVHTLHIGINAYERSPLKLCVGDVIEVKKRFEEWGMLPKNMVTLLDKDADTQNMKRALEDLVKRSNANDVVIIQYSGHGSQLPCLDEEDGKMELICPVDIHRDFEKYNCSDDFICGILSGLSAKNVLPYLMPFDCCHTGGMTRTLSSDLYTGIRYLAPPLEAVYRNARTYRSREYAETNNVVMFGGCQSDQVSYEYAKAGHGALTWAFLNATKERGLAGTPQEVFIPLAKQVTGVFPEQHPVLEGKQALFHVPFFTQFV